MTKVALFPVSNLIPDSRPSNGIDVTSKWAAVVDLILRRGDACNGPMVADGHTRVNCGVGTARSCDI